MRFDDAADAYIADRAGRAEIRPYSARQIRFRLSTLTACHPNLTLEALDGEAVRVWQHHIGGLKPASRRAYQSSLHGFCAWCVERGLIDVDPTAGLRRVREERQPPRALTAGQISRLLLVLPDERARLMVALLWRLALRRGEVAGLVVGDYDPGRRLLRVCGKNGDTRLMPVPVDLAVDLEAWCDRRSGSLFGVAPARVGRLVAAWMRQAGVKTCGGDRVSAHSLRHTGASDMFDRCHNPRTVQFALGHANLATTEIYLRHATLDELRHAVGDTQVSSHLTAR
jgi:integrase/recombinase XerC